MTDKTTLSWSHKYTPYNTAYITIYHEYTQCIYEPTTENIISPVSGLRCQTQTPEYHNSRCEYITNRKKTQKYWRKHRKMLVGVEEVSVFFSTHVCMCILCTNFYFFFIWFYVLTFCNSIVMLLLSHAFVPFLFTFESTLDGEKTNRVRRDGHIFTLLFFL